MYCPPDYRDFAMSIELNAAMPKINAAEPPDSWKGTKLFVNDQEGPLDRPFFVRSWEVNKFALELPSTVGREISLNLVSDKDFAFARPDFGEWLKVDGNTARCEISQATPESGVFKLVAVSRDVVDVLEIEGTFVPKNLDELVRVELNGAPIPADPTVLSRTPFELSLIPINDMEIPVSMEFVSGVAIGESEINVSPPFGQIPPLPKWDFSVDIDRNATFSVRFKPAVLEMSSIEKTIEVKALVPKIFFQGVEVQSGATVSASVGYSHSVKFDAWGTGFENTYVQVKENDGTSNAHITPASTIPMTPEADFTLVTKNVKDTVFILDILTRQNIHLGLYLKVDSRNKFVTPEIVEIQPRGEFYANELCYFDAEVADQNDPSLKVEGANVGAQVLGIPIPHSVTDKEGKGFIYVLLPAGDYLLKAFCSLGGEEKQWHRDVSFTVKPER